MGQKSPEYTSIDETRRYLGVSRAMVSQWIAKGRLRAKREGGQVLVYLDSVDALAKARAAKPSRVRPAKLDAYSEYRGRMAALVFPLLKAGLDLYTITVETRCDPLVVRELRRQFMLSFEDGDALAARELRMRSEEIAAERHDKRLQREDWRKLQLQMAQHEGPIIRELLAALKAVLHKQEQQPVAKLDQVLGPLGVRSGVRRRAAPPELLRCSGV